MSTYYGFDIMFYRVLVGPYLYPVSSPLAASDQEVQPSEAHGYHRAHLSIAQAFHTHSLSPFLGIQASELPIPTPNYIASKSQTTSYYYLDWSGKSLEIVCGRGDE